MRISRGLVVSSATLGLLVAACQGSIVAIGPSGSADPAPAASTDAVTGTVSGKPGPHAIGGTVAGLAGQGLVLQVNGGNDLAVGENGGFVFPTKLAKGAAFGVTVKAQPTGPNQLCVLGGDTGTVGDADVRSVTVDCFTDRYVVGGTVSGVSGSGVLLQLNGGNDVRVSNAGTFAFPAPLASQTLYTATVKANPTGPTQTCTVANGVGMVADRAAQDIVVTCRTDEYTLSGATSGYAGKGLVLHNAVTNEDLAVGAEGTFRFATTVPSKGSFDISVKTQPSDPAQACTVSGGQGSNVSGDVSSVVVNCSTRSFTVGGTASGLAGSATLVFNGVDRVVSSNGPIAFGTLASGTPYTATLKAKPQSPSQTCAVTGGSGKVGGGPVTDIALACTTDTFTVSGTLTGATGGVALENIFDSDDEIFALNGDGTFTFTKPVPSGENYLIDVKSGPATQSCTVGGPSSGKMGNGNVTGVTITCVDKFHTVGGSVTGLPLGGSIELANGSDTKTLAADGPFTFDTKVLEGAAYNVTVKTAPNSQVCTVTAGSGTMGTAAVDGVSVSCVTITTSSFAYTGSLQTFTVPAGVSSLHIDARGAQGGGGGALGGIGGLGARVEGDFAVTAGQVLTLLVGGAGLPGQDSGERAGGSGGGGTFVVAAGNVALAVAGGGGGAMGRSGLVVDGGPGLAGNDGATGQTGGGAGGTAGGGGGTWPWTGWHSGTGGGGFSGDGLASSNGSGSFGAPHGPGMSFLNGGAGGTPGADGRVGGYGGGGAGGFTGAGGGGYSGGGSGTHNAPGTPNGGGGGSYNAGSNPVSTAGYNTGDGAIDFSW